MKFINSFLIFVSVLKVVIALKTYEKCLNSGDIALIFDNKPSSRTVNKILKVLNEENVKAKLIINGVNELNTKVSFILLIILLIVI